MTAISRRKALFGGAAMGAGAAVGGLASTRVAAAPISPENPRLIELSRSLDHLEGELQTAHGAFKVAYASCAARVPAVPTALIVTRENFKPLNAWAENERS